MSSSKITYVDKVLKAKFTFGDANEIKTVVNSHADAIDFNVLSLCTYNTEIPLNKAITVMTGKTLASNDTFTILAGPIEGASCVVYLIGNGTNAPVDTAFGYKKGFYDSTTGVINECLMYYLDGKAIIAYSQLTATA